MRNDVPYTCMETCKQEKPCGNRYCSAHPKHHQAKKPDPVGRARKPPDKR